MLLFCWYVFVIVLKFYDKVTQIKPVGFKSALSCIWTFRLRQSTKYFSLHTSPSGSLCINLGLETLLIHYWTWHICLWAICSQLWWFWCYLRHQQYSFYADDFVCAKLIWLIFFFHPLARCIHCLFTGQNRQPKKGW